MNRDLTDYFLYALAAVLVCFILLTGSTAFAGRMDTERAVATEQPRQLDSLPAVGFSPSNCEPFIIEPSIVILALALQAHSSGEACT